MTIEVHFDPRRAEVERENAQLRTLLDNFGEIITAQAEALKAATERNRLMDQAIAASGVQILAQARFGQGFVDKKGNKLWYVGKNPKGSSPHSAVMLYEDGTLRKCSPKYGFVRCQSLDDQFLSKSVEI